MSADAAHFLARLPLADATWLLWDKIFPDADLDQFYDTHRGACYRREFSFAQLVYLLNDALCRRGGRAHATLHDHANSDQCPASRQAFYGKLRRMPIPLSEAFLADGSRRLRPWLRSQPFAPLPACLGEFRILVLDGKTLKHAAKRLKPARGRAGRGLGGKLLVALEPATGLLVGMAADPDGHTNEAKLVPRLLPDLRDRLPGVRLWMADQLFGDLAQVRRLTEHGDHCVLRLHTKSLFTVDGDAPTRQGVDARGRAWIDERGALHSRREGTLPMRRITLPREGDTPLTIVTDLLDAERYPANDLLELYRQRWGIEQVFQKVSEVFHLRHLIGSSPRAMIFQASLCMTLYNLLQVIRGLVAEAQGRPTAEISAFHLFDDLRSQLIAMYTLVPAGDWLSILRARAAGIEDLRACLRERLTTAWTTRWIKSPPKKRHVKPTKHKRGTGGHFSIHRALIESQGKDV